MSRSIREQMQADLVTALPGGDPAAVAVVRTTLAALANAEAIDPAVDGPPVRVGLFGDVERRRLSADDVVSIVADEHQELEAATAVLDAAGRPVEAADCRARAAILDRYLAVTTALHPDAGRADLVGAPPRDGGCVKRREGAGRSGPIRRLSPR